ncbi:aspartyl protease [Oscillatoriales cyanobacterium USR001]|nr:aspartyl protease [Oscillatoriales cyanobacterium USR001]
MIEGYFGTKGELYFEIELIAADGSAIAVNALLDTGFTDWLAMNTQDIDSLGWSYIRSREMYTAGGDAEFNLYAGTMILDGQEFAVPVLGGEEITEFLIGLQWLETRRLVVDRKAGLLTLD